MTTPDLTAVKIGSRVHVKLTSGDEATFTVTYVNERTHRLTSKHNVFSTGTIEALTVLSTPLPTEPGVYLPYTYDNGSTPNVFLLKKSGEWLELPNEARHETRVLRLADIERYHRAGTLTFLGSGR